MIFFDLQTDAIQKEQAWFLQEVEITNVKKKKSWSFVCNNWLSLHHGDQQTTRELYPNISSKTGQLNIEAEVLWEVTLMNSKLVFVSHEVVFLEI